MNEQQKKDEKYPYKTCNLLVFEDKGEHKKDLVILWKFLKLLEINEVL